MESIEICSKFSNISSMTDYIQIVLHNYYKHINIKTGNESIF